MLHSEKIDLIIQALGKAQSKSKFVVKDAANPFFKSKYAPLENYIQAFHEWYSPEGLAFTQCGAVLNDKTYLCTTLWHVTGQWVSSYYPIVQDKPGPQALGAAWTYAKRYDLASITGLPSSDDDAESAMNRSTHHEKAQDYAVPSQNKQVLGVTPAPLVTEKQIKRLFAIAKKSGWSNEDVKAYLGKMGLEHTKDLTWMMYDSLINKMEQFPKHFADSPETQDFDKYLKETSA